MSQRVAVLWGQEAIPIDGMMASSRRSRQTLDTLRLKHRRSAGIMASRLTATAGPNPQAEWYLLCGHRKLGSS